MEGHRSPHARRPVRIPVQFQTDPPAHILVVEDDSCLRRLNTEVLLRGGYEVDATADGAAAWQALNTDSYDLLITDNNMPEVSGVQLVKKLRAARMALPVIMATGTLSEQEFAQYPWLQPAVNLLKPYTARKMLKTVKQVLRAADRAAAGSQRLRHRDLKDIPSAQVPAPAGAPLPGPANPARRILVVDEDHDLRQLYAEALAGHGYHVDAAEDGVAAWEALRANRYHLLITEHEMPHLTGVELVKMLRGARMAVPVVMVAGRLPACELARNPALQLAASLSKPFAVDALLDTVKSVLRATDSAPGPIEPPPNWRSQPSAVGRWR